MEEVKPMEGVKPLEEVKTLEGVKLPEEAKLLEEVMGKSDIKIDLYLVLGLAEEHHLDHKDHRAKQD